MTQKMYLTPLNLTPLNPFKSDGPTRIYALFAGAITLQGLKGGLMGSGTFLLSLWVFWRQCEKQYFGGYPSDMDV